MITAIDLFCGAGGLTHGWVSPWPVQPWLVERENIEQSPDEQVRYVGVPAMNAMIHVLSKGMDLYLDTRIDRLESNDDKWRLWDGNGEHYGQFDAVVLTAPLAQSLALLPEGSSLEASLRTANMTPTWAFAMSLEQSTDIKAEALFSNNGIVTWAAKDSAKPGRPNKYETWLMHFSAQWTANHLEASEDLLQQQVVHLLERLSNKAIPEVHQAFKHRWLYARSSGNADSISQWDADKRIGLAGDWTIGSRLEDAWLSANYLSQTLLDAFD